MQPVFLATVFFCLLATVYAASPVSLNATCTYADGGQSNCADPNAVCIPATGSTCQCKDGYQASGTTCTAKNDGSAPGHLSIWLLCTTFMTMSLAVYVV